MSKIPILFRFSLYGFLKNQQYYEPFIILAFIEKGLSFFLIGVLIAFRSICINLMEIPSGAVADLYGRRLSMILSFLSYIISFIIFGFSSVLWMLFLAMFFFAVGESFRTGTHKAMIFAWLKDNDRTSERTKIYGYTRSWSKMGSAISVVIATALVFWSGKYSHIFFFCIIPYTINILNFMGYPKSVDVCVQKDVSFKKIFWHLYDSFKQVLCVRDLRRVLLEDIGFEGTYKTVKDYLQPIINAAAVALPVLLFFDAQKRTAVIIGVVYFLLHFLSGVASRKAHVLVDKVRAEEKAARVLWWANFLVFLILIPLLWTEYYLLAAILFIVLAVLENLWRPILISRIDSFSDDKAGATILSIESQSRTFFVMIMAPLVGFVVDQVGFYVVAVMGLLVSSFALLGRKKII